MNNPSQCNECNGTLHILGEDGIWKPCKCLIEKKHRRRLIETGIPRYMVDYEWKQWAQKHVSAKKAAKELRAWQKKVVDGDVKRCMCLYGKASTGKYTLALLVVRDCVQAGLTAKVVTLSELIQDRFSSDPQFLVDKALTVDLLCVRLGMEEEHKWRGSVLEKIHFGRKVEHLPTLYTTRVQSMRFEQQYGKVLHDVFFLAKQDVRVWDLNIGEVIVQ